MLGGEGSDGSLTESGANVPIHPQLCSNPTRNTSPIRLLGGGQHRANPTQSNLLQQNVLDEHFSY